MKQKEGGGLELHRMYRMASSPRLLKASISIPARYLLLRRSTRRIIRPSAYLILVTTPSRCRWFYYVLSTLVCWLLWVCVFCGCSLRGWERVRCSKTFALWVIHTNSVSSNCSVNIGGHCLDCCELFLPMPPWVLYSLGQGVPGDWWALFIQLLRNDWLRLALLLSVKGEWCRKQIFLKNIGIYK